MSSRLKIGLLIGAHAILGALFVIDDSTRDFLPVSFLDQTFLFSQVQLYGIWMGLASMGWRKRAVALLGGLLLCVIARHVSEITWFIDAREWPTWGRFFTFLVFPHFFIMTSIASVFAFWRKYIVRRKEHSPKQVIGFPQFSLRALLFGILFACISFGMLTTAHAHFETLHNGVITIGLLYACCGVLLSSTAAWACLGNGYLVVRLPLTLLTAAAVGLIPPLTVYGRDFVANLDLIDFVDPILNSVFLLLSLLVVRSCGYRLVPLRSAEVHVMEAPAQ